MKQRNKLTAIEMFGVARHKAAQRLKYMAPAIYKLEPHAVPGSGPESVTKDAVLVWDPVYWVEHYTVDQGAFGIAHETLHMVLRTFERIERGGLDHEVANVAADLCINVVLRQAGFTSHDQDLFPAKFNLPDNFSMEQYYQALMSLKQQGKLPTSGPRRPGSGKCGSGGGCKGPNEPESRKVPGAPRGRSKAEMERACKAVAENIKQEKGRGSVPMGLQIWADKILTPSPIRWTYEMSREIGSIVQFRPGGCIDTYEKRSRRQQVGPTQPIMPANHRPSPMVVLAVDSSGSMLGPGKDLALVAREVWNIFQDLQLTELWFVVADAEVHTFERITSAEQAEVLFVGGGGTDFSPVFEAVEKMDRLPDLMIYGTDGMGSAPSEPPPFETIWLLTDKNVRKPAHWGREIRVNLDSGKEENEEC